MSVIAVQVETRINEVIEHTRGLNEKLKGDDRSVKKIGKLEEITGLIAQLHELHVHMTAVRAAERINGKPWGANCIYEEEGQTTPAIVPV